MNLQLACTLGEIDDPRASERLSKLALQHAADPFIVAAVLSSLNKSNYAQTMQAAFRDKKDETSALLGRLVSLAHWILADETTFATLLTTITHAENGTHAPWQLDALAVCLDSLGSGNLSLAKMLEKESAENLAARKSIDGIFEFARASVTPKNTPAERVRAIKLLGRGLDGRDTDIDLLVRLLGPQFDSETQSAAVTALAALGDPKIGEMLLANWKSCGSALRAQILQTVIRKESWTLLELAMLEEKKILPNELDATQRARAALAFERRAQSARYRRKNLRRHDQPGSPESRGRIQARAMAN